MSKNTMYATSAQSLTKKTLISSINLYQEYLSPRKGFACPHRLAYGGASCSDYVKNILLDQDLRSVFKMSRQRFKNCAIASHSLHNQKTQGGCIVIPCCLPF